MATILIVFKTLVMIAAGPEWDSYAFLLNAADIAGQGVGYTEPHRPPFMSLLAAVPMLFGVVETSTIQWVDAGLSVLAVAGLFKILERRFSLLVSGVGALTMLGVVPLWEWLGSGYTDLPSVGIALWALHFCIKATEEDSRWYVAAAATLVAGIMTRYTIMLAFFPLAVWVFSRWKPFAHARRLVVSLGAALLAYVPAAVFYQSRFGDVLFPFVVALGFSEEFAAPGGEGAVASSGAWYLENLPTLFGPEQLAVVTLIVLGAGLAGLFVAATRYLATSRPRAGRLVAATIALALPVAIQFAGGGLLARQLSIPLSIAIIWRTLGPREDEQEPRRLTAAPALDAAMLTWLLVYFDFHGHQNIQVDRYLIPMVPGLIYLALLGWHGWSLTAASPRGRGTRSTVKTPGVRAALLLVPLLLALSAGVAVGVATTDTARNADAYNGRISAEWLLDEQPGLDDAVIYSDYWPITSWYLGSAARPMPLFAEDRSFEHELEKHQADYFITYRQQRYPSFTEVWRGETASVLQRETPARALLPRIQYLGSSWQNYVEPLTGYAFDFMYTGGRYGWEGSALLDSSDADELTLYDAVAVYGARWRDLTEAEATLREYVLAGGSLVVDASANLDPLSYSLRDTVTLDTLIRHGQLPADAELHVDARFVATYPELRDLATAPFVDEAGAAWSGAEYTPLDASTPHDVIVSADGRPVITVQKMGDGRIYWIGYNLVWHAFWTGSDDEARLVAAVFEDAIAHSSTGTE